MALPHKFAAIRIALLLAGIAAAWAPAQAQIARLPPPDGRLIRARGHLLHLRCLGSGTPTVILENGAEEFSFDWSLVMPLVASETRVCAWDRAGHAWSSMSPDFERFPAVAADLNDLLRNGGVKPPYVLVGHALGALYARDYQRTYPGQVAALALIDPQPEEDTQVPMMGNTVSLIDMADHDLVAWPVRPYAASRTSPVADNAGSGDGTDPFRNLPAPVRAIRSLALAHLRETLDGLSSSGAIAVMESERAAFTALYNARHDPHTSPLNLPLVVVSRGRNTDTAITRMQDEMAALSRNSTHLVAAGSGTQIHIEDPPLTASAILGLVRNVRMRSAPGAIPVQPAR